MTSLQIKNIFFHKIDSEQWQLFIYIKSTILLFTSDTVLYCSVLKLLNTVLIVKLLIISLKKLYIVLMNMNRVTDEIKELKQVKEEEL